jgi:hypothetical protein
VRDAGLELAGVERGEAEVVEEVLAQLELGELVATDEKAPSGSTSAQMTAPAQPSSGSRRSAISEELAAFHG